MYKVNINNIEQLQKFVIQIIESKQDTSNKKESVINVFDNFVYLACQKERK